MYLLRGKRETKDGVELTLEAVPPVKGRVWHGLTFKEDGGVKVRGIVPSDVIDSLKEHAK